MANDFRSFSLKLDAFSAKVKIASANVIKHIALDFFRHVVMNTPVDTGRARASWTIAVNQADRSVMPEAHEGAVYPAAQAGFLSVGPGDSVIISNNLPYITVLENGRQAHSGSIQAPFGMVAISMMEVRANTAVLIAAGVQDAGL